LIPTFIGSLKKELASLKRRSHKDNELISELSEELSHANQRAVDSALRAEDLENQLDALRSQQDSHKDELESNTQGRIEALRTSFATAREAHRVALEATEERARKLQGTLAVSEAEHAKALRQAKDEERTRLKHAKQVSS
jgi:chromosome segregation ATPase